VGWGVAGGANKQREGVISRCPPYKMDSEHNGSACRCNRPIRTYYKTIPFPPARLSWSQMVLALYTEVENTEWLLVSSACSPYPLTPPYIYAIFFPSRSLHPEDGGSMDVRKIGSLPLHHTSSQTRKPRLESWPQWSPPVSTVLLFHHCKTKAKFTCIEAPSAEWRRRG